jgi:hypothetical protein
MKKNQNLGKAFFLLRLLGEFVVEGEFGCVFLAG